MSSRPHPVRAHRAHATAFLLAIAVIGGPTPASASGYTLPWTRVADGGATFATGAGYRLGGTIGQSDAGLRSGGAYVLRDGFWGPRPTHLTGVPPGATPSLVPFRLAAPAPNPFHGSTELSFGLPSASAVELDVFDVTGHRVRSLARERFGAGDVHVRWDGTDDSGHPAHAGIYFVRLDAGGHRTTQRVVLLP